jgi:hypothetical protein
MRPPKHGAVKGRNQRSPENRIQGLPRGIGTSEVPLRGTRGPPGVGGQEQQFHWLEFRATRFSLSPWNSIGPEPGPRLSRLGSLGVPPGH